MTRNPITLALCLVFVLVFTFLYKNSYSLLPADPLSKEKRLAQVLCQQDSERINNLTAEDFSNFTSGAFFKTVMFPIQTACTNLKRIGGVWAASGYDGVKYVCFDDLLLQTDEPCLIYSFGIGQEASFEKAMVDYGCSVHAYDHTMPKDIAAKFNIQESKFSAHLHGVSLKTEGDLYTLNDILSANGHTTSYITYLKMDIEGPEIDLLPAWLSSGLLDRVKQIGVEFHKVDGDNLPRYYKVIRALHEKGWKVIAFDPNWDAEVKNRFFLYFEIVFRNVRTSCEFDS